MDEFSGRDVGLPEYVLETDRFLRIDGVSTVFAISRYSYGRKTAESGTTVSLPYPRNPIRRYWYVAVAFFNANLSHTIGFISYLFIASECCIKQIMSAA